MNVIYHLAESLHRGPKRKCVYGNVIACGPVVNRGGLFVSAVYLKLSVTSPQDYYYYTKFIYLRVSIWNSEKRGRMWEIFGAQFVCVNVGRITRMMDGPAVGRHAYPDWLYKLLRR